MGSTPASIATHAKEGGVTSPRSPIWLEVGAFILCIGYLFFLLRDVLFLGSATLAHDNLFWTLPVFTYFAEGIGNGMLPLWNPYSHGGEPLAHVYLTTRLLDPVSIAVAWLGQLVTSDLVLLANWDRVLKALLAAMGAYLLLRQWTVSVLVRIALVPALVLSNFTANALWQPGILDQFVYTPFFLIFLLNLLRKRDYRWHNWVGAATFFGASLQSYFFVGPSLAAALVFLGFVLFRRDDAFALFKTRSNWPKILLGLLIVVAMAGPQAYLYRNLDQFDLPPREGAAAASAPAPAKVGMSYETIRQTGSFAQLQDFLGLLVPGLLFLRRTSEAGQYLGGLVFLGALYGLVFASHPLKRIWLLVGVSVGLLMLGPMGGLHWLLYQVFPPLWFLRHTEQLVNLFQLAVLFFFVVGAEAWLQHWRHGNPALSTSASSPTPGPLTRLFGNAEHARALAIVLVVGAVLIAGPYLARGYAERPTFFRSASLAFLAIGAAIYLLRRDLGRWTLAGTIVLGMLGLTALLTNRTDISSGVIDVFLQVWLYAMTFILLPLTVIYAWWHKGDAESDLDSKYGERVGGSTESAIRLIGFTLFLSVAIGFFNLPPAFNMSAAHVVAHVVLSILAALSSLGILHPRWLIASAPKLYARLSIVRYVAGLFFLVLLVLSVYLKVKGYFEIHAFFYLHPIQDYFGTSSFFHFHWLGLTLACAILAMRPHLLPEALSTIRNTATALRFVTSALLLCCFVPAALIALQAVSSGNTALQRDAIGIGGFYIFVASVGGGISLWAALRNKHRKIQKPGKAFGFIRASGNFVPSLLVVWIALDLAAFVAMVATSLDISGIYSKPLWNVPRPENVYAAQGQPRTPVFSSHRVITPPVSPEIGTYVYRAGQEMRYADLFARKASMLDLPTDMRKRPAEDIATAPLEKQLGLARHNGFIQLRGYSELLRSGMPAEALSEIFALDRPLIQFRPCTESQEAFLSQARSMPREEAMSLLRRAVLLDGASQTESPCQASGADENRFAYQVLKYDYDTIRLKINAPANGYLYYADGYDPYWVASVDGKFTAVQQANFNFKAVPVGMGEHEVELAYQPFTLRFLIAVYFMVFLLGLATVFASFARSRA